MLPTQEQITPAVQKICTQYFDVALTVTLDKSVLPDDWGRHYVWRYRLQSSANNIPQTIIAKIAKVDTGHLFNEWASLLFLNQFDVLHPLVPRLYGGNEALQLLVMEDLGHVRGKTDLGTILEGDNPELAQEALVQHAHQMAKLHIATHAHEYDYTTIRTGLSESKTPISKDNFTLNFHWFRSILPRFHLTVSSSFDSEVQQLIYRLQSTASVRAFTRGDTCPSNIAYHNNQMKFYDFEMGQFRAVALSAVYFRVLHLSCLNGNLIPLDIQAETERVYLDAIQEIIPNRDSFIAEYTSAKVATLVWVMSLWVEKEDRPRHLVTRHQRIFAILQAVLHDDNLSVLYPTIHQILQAIHAQLVETWSQEKQHIAIFPAFISKD